VNNLLKQAVLSLSRSMTSVCSPTATCCQRWKPELPNLLKRLMVSLALPPHDHPQATSGLESAWSYKQEDAIEAVFESKQTWQPYLWCDLWLTVPAVAASNDLGFSVPLFRLLL